MRGPTKAAGKLAKARRRKTATRKSRNPPKAVRHRSSSVAGQDTKVARLTRERDEARARENATGEILASISGSMTAARLRDQTQGARDGAESLLTKPIDFGSLRSEIDMRVERAA